MITSSASAGKALIGDSGYVGGSLRGQTGFASAYRSTNIGQIDGQDFAVVVCAGAPGKKWIANQDPQSDRQNLERLMSHLAKVSCDTFVLISTVDVFKHPVAVDELTVVDEVGLRPYGLHRRLLESFVASEFPNHLIVRLPGLVGPGLRKNVIYDFLHHNDLHAIDSRGIFQFYPMVNLWYDIQLALRAGLNLVHLTAAPISVAEVAALGFDRPFEQALTGDPAVYDMRSRHADIFGAAGSYQYSRRETLLAIRAYAQGEARTGSVGP